jgi:hypothetical protein
MRTTGPGVNDSPSCQTEGRETMQKEYKMEINGLLEQGDFSSYKNVYNRILEIGQRRP